MKYTISKWGDMLQLLGTNQLHKLFESFLHRHFFLPYNWIVKSFIYIGVNLWILILKLEFSPVLFLFCSNCYSFGSRLLCPFGIPINIFCLFLFLALFLIFGTIRWLRLIFYIWSPSSKILSNFTNVHVYRTIPHSVGNIAQPPLRKASGEWGPAHRTHG